MKFPVVLTGSFRVIMTLIITGLALTSWADNPWKDPAVDQLMRTSKYPEAARLIQRTMRSLKPEETERWLYCCNVLTIAQLRMRNVDSALLYARQALRFAARSKDSILVVNAWKSAAYAYNNHGNLDSALFFTSKMLQFGERNKDTLLTRNSLTSLATILSQNNRYVEAKGYFIKANQFTRILGDSLNFASGYFNFGLNYLNLKNYDTCLLLLDSAFFWAEKYHQYDVLVYILGTKADCYQQMKNPKEQMKYLIRANEIAEKLGNQQFLAMGFSNLAQSALDLKSYSEAIQYGRKALKSLEIQPYPILKVKVDSILWIACRMTGQFREALDYHEEFSKGKTAILGEKQHQQLNELTLTLKVREKDLTIANQQLELVKKQRYQITLILITIIIGLLVIGQFIYIMKTRKHRQMLFRKDKAADDQANEMREWMEWKLSKEKSTGASVTGEGDPSEREDQPGDENWSQRELYAELREIFEKQKIYLDPELNLNTVIKLLGTNRKYLYQAMSGSSDDNFRTFINRYRVDEAKHVINAQVLNGEEVNFPELYTYAGFNSPASFYRVFKSVTGLTPKEYASEIVRMQHTTQP